jgi:hypothetical protein
LRPSAKRKERKKLKGGKRLTAFGGFGKVYGVRQRECFSFASSHLMLRSEYVLLQETLKERERKERGENKGKFSLPLKFFEVFLI